MPLLFGASGETEVNLFGLCGCRRQAAPALNRVAAGTRSVHGCSSVRVRKTLFGSSVYSANGEQYVKPKLSYRRRAAWKAGMEPVSRLRRA